MLASSTARGSDGLGEIEPKPGFRFNPKTTTEQPAGDKAGRGDGLGEIEPEHLFGFDPKRITEQPAGNMDYR